jgi:hypothetical protein
MSTSVYVRFVCAQQQLDGLHLTCQHSFLMLWFALVRLGKTAQLLSILTE